MIFYAALVVVTMFIILFVIKFATKSKTNKTKLGNLMKIDYPTEEHYESYKKYKEDMEKLGYY